MKIKGIINFLLVVLGAVFLASGNSFVQSEYAMSIGIVLLMLGVYRTSRGWSRQEDTQNENNG